VHFRIEINLRYLEGFVTEPGLDLHQVEARTRPVCRRRLEKSAEIVLLARGPRDG
jgi:hypothetical protein